jgi:hypothetical protein
MLGLLGIGGLFILAGICKAEEKFKATKGKKPISLI